MVFMSVDFKLLRAFPDAVATLTEFPEGKRNSGNFKEVPLEVVVDTFRPLGGRNFCNLNLTCQRFHRICSAAIKQIEARWNEECKHLARAFDKEFEGGAEARKWCEAEAVTLKAELRTKRELLFRYLRPPRSTLPVPAPLPKFLLEMIPKEETAPKRSYINANGNLEVIVSGNNITPQDIFALAVNRHPDLVPYLLQEVDWQWGENLASASEFLWAYRHEQRTGWLHDYLMPIVRQHFCHSSEVIGLALLNTVNGAPLSQRQDFLIHVHRNIPESQIDCPLDKTEPGEMMDGLLSLCLRLEDLEKMIGFLHECLKAAARCGYHRALQTLLDRCGAKIIKIHFFLEDGLSIGVRMAAETGQNQSAQMILDCRAKVLSEVNVGVKRPSEHQLEGSLEPALEEAAKQGNLPLVRLIQSHAGANRNQPMEALRLAYQNHHREVFREILKKMNFDQLNYDRRAWGVLREILKLAENNQDRYTIQAILKKLSPQNCKEMLRYWWVWNPNGTPNRKPTKESLSIEPFERKIAKKCSFETAELQRFFIENVDSANLHCIMILLSCFGASLHSDTTDLYKLRNPSEEISACITEFHNQQTGSRMD